MMDHYYTHTLATKHRITDPNGMRDVVNLDHHIHCLEIEAYSSLLKAFIAQSDLLTWGKEELLTELRKELNIADSEHGEILTKINSDESIRRIREQRKMTFRAQEHIKAKTHERPSASIGNSIVRLKAPPAAAFHPNHNISRSQASLSSMHILSSIPPKFNENTRTAEFVHGRTEKSNEMFNYDVQLLPIGRGRPPTANYQFKQYSHPSESLVLNNRSDLIQIRATDCVIHDVEKMLFCRDNPGPLDIERAKQILDEQERALLEALGKLANVLEGG